VPSPLAGGARCSAWSTLCIHTRWTRWPCLAGGSPCV